MRRRRFLTATTGVAASLSGCAGWEFHFPGDFTLASDASVTLYTGSGEYTDSELYWGSSPRSGRRRTP